MHLCISFEKRQKVINIFSSCAHKKAQVKCSRSIIILITHPYNLFYGCIYFYCGSNHQKNNHINYDGVHTREKRNLTKKNCVQKKICPMIKISHVNLHFPFACEHVKLQHNIHTYRKPLFSKAQPKFIVNRS